MPPFFSAQTLKGLDFGEVLSTCPLKARLFTSISGWVPWKLRHSKSPVTVKIMALGHWPLLSLVELLSLELSLVRDWTCLIIVGQMLQQIKFVDVSIQRCDYKDP